ncbi:MAG: GlxA family transcriptional regulator [Acetobacteraceae bacterium]
MDTAVPPVRVALLVLPESYPGGLYSLHELFGSVGTTWSQLTGEAEATSRRFQPILISRDGKPVRSPAGPLIHVDCAIGDLPTADLVIVTDLAVALDGSAAPRWPDEADWVRACHAAGAIVCSICSGSVFLAAAGLLDGLEATTHWAMAPVFRDHFPSIRLQPARILCPAGAEHRVVTAGGASSWAELALYLVARFCGEVEARRMAKLFILGDKSDGQLPFAAMARPRQHADAAVAAAQLWLADNYTVPNPVARMAEAARLTERTFSRRFRKATGYAPVEYVQALRLEEAKQMLETTGEATDTVAAAVGYADPVFFRRIFKRMVGVTPSRYRQRLATLGRVRG